MPLKKQTQLEEFEANSTHHAEGIDVIEDKQLDTADDDVIEGEVVYMKDREAIIDINAKSEGVIFIERISLQS